MILLALLLNAGGFLLLALDDPRHRDTLLGRGRSLRPGARSVAWALIGASYLGLLPAIDAATALVVFTGLSTAAAGATVLAIILARRLRPTDRRA